MSMLCPINIFDEYFKLSNIKEMYDMFESSKHREKYNEFCISLNKLRTTLSDLIESHFDDFESDQEKIYVLTEVFISLDNKDLFTEKSDYIRSSNILKIYHWLLFKRSCTTDNNLFFLLINNTCTSYRYTNNYELDYYYMHYIDYYSKLVPNIMDLHLKSNYKIDKLENDNFDLLKLLNDFFSTSYVKLEQVEIRIIDI